MTERILVRAGPAIIDWVLDFKKRGPTIDRKTCVNRCIHRLDIAVPRDGQEWKTSSLFTGPHRMADTIRKD
jgi:hypothetical protein